MRNLKFRNVPESNIEKFPFNVNTSDFSVWMNSLSMTSSSLSCKKIHSVLMALVKSDIQTDLKYLFLQDILAYLDDFSERIEIIFVDSGYPLTESEQENVEILAWSYMLLAKGFSDLFLQIDSKPNDSNYKERNRILYSFFYAKAKVQLYVNQVYLLEPDNFWTSCYQNYLQAEKYDFLNQSFTQNSGKSQSINDIFKQILIFNICDCNRFTFREMKNLFTILKDFSSDAIITNEPIKNLDSWAFSFDLESDSSPVKWTDQIPDDRMIRYIDVIPVAKRIYNSLRQTHKGSTTLQSVNQTLLLKVISMLSREQKRKNTRVDFRDKMTGYLQFNNVASAVAKTKGKSFDSLLPQLKQHDPRVVGMWSDNPDFELVPEGDEMAHQMSQKRRIGTEYDHKTAKIIEASGPTSLRLRDWSKGQDERSRLSDKLLSGSFEIFNTSVKGYGLLWKPEASQKVKIGEIIGIEYLHEKRHEIGIIARIEVQTDHSLKLGVELIGLESDLVWLESNKINKGKGMLAIYIPAIEVMKQPDSIVVPVSNLVNGQDIEIYKDKIKINYKLGERLHSTQLIHQYALIK